MPESFGYSLDALVIQKPLSILVRNMKIREQICPAVRNVVVNGIAINIAILLHHHAS
jgi:hypothetical protein